MKAKKLLFLAASFVGLMIMMSTTCETDDIEDPGTCSGAASAISTGNVEGTYCFDNVTTYTYDPANMVTFWARETNTEMGMDLTVYAPDGGTVSNGTYDCADSEAFVELITSHDGEFYKSKSGTVTITNANATNFSASFNVSCEGYYNHKTINFSGTISK